MNKDRRFWLALGVFQIGFGALVFGITREYYSPDPQVAASATELRGNASTEWTVAVDDALIESLTSLQPATNDPVEIARLANASFSAKEYTNAAEYYDRLLKFDPDNPDVRNNLALTLQYLGRSNVALQHLLDNVERHPEHQRSWLTLGFVYGQTGDTAGARRALGKAIDINANNGVGRSAQDMLNSLR